MKIARPFALRFMGNVCRFDAARVNARVMFTPGRIYRARYIATNKTVERDVGLK